jgi:hypothetical protein
VLDNVTIAYRGATYEIGRGRDYFGLWTLDAPRSQPMEWWPETQEGWSSAWARFAALETPDTITAAGRGTGQSAERGPAGQPFAGPAGILSGGRGALVAAVLLGVGVMLGIAGLFGDYLNGASLASQSDNLVPHVIYLVVWAASAVLIALGGSRLRVGALLATGLSIVTFGLFLADAGTPIAGGVHLAGLGLVLSLLGWLACAAGSAVAFFIRPARSADATGTGWRRLPLGRPRGAALGPAVLLILAGLGVAAAFAPSWDSFTVRTAAGQTQVLTAGNAFANPGAVIAGNVAVMVAVAVVVIAAALWRPARLGAVLLAGAVIPMVAQAISALVQVGEPVSATQFGFTPAQVSELGLTVSSGLTLAFWVYGAFVLVLVVSFAWMLFTPQEPAGLTGAGTGAAGHGPDTEVPTWHVARADAYDRPGAPSGEFDDEFGDEDSGDEDSGAGDEPRDEPGDEPAGGIDRPASARPAEPF